MKLLLSLSLRLRLPLSHSTLPPGNGLCNNCHHHIAFHPLNHPSIWFMHLSIHLSGHPSGPSIHPSIPLSIHLSIWSIYPSFCPPVCPSICSSIHPSVHLPSHPCLPPSSQQHLHSPFPDDPWFPEARFGLWITSHSSPTPYLGVGTPCSP